MSTGLLIVLAVLLSYLLGAVPAGTWVARLRGVDIRTVGSGNSGATNVQRSLGWGPGLVVGCFDILKGGLAVWLARQFHLDESVAALCGLCAVLGHNFSVFSGFRGGKGVATSFGVLLLIDPLAGAAIFPIAFCVMYLTRYVSAGSMVGAVSALVIEAALGRPWWELLISLILAALMFYQHRQNIVRLRLGTESRFGQRVAAPEPKSPKVMN
ncbi:glycerol-3-phosphate 1-O-acyltransferase PlsY [Deinococcus sp. KNUC1210]|uniref:glycerol-3-phosphate 1-O-acyltransferase PlsY n=1 Tax=Deinococcus sp. KNUC1210 TaxID=2917691 RepID=UPI001EF025B3|nr:glycerol-3-phosphate 1-O-acyltransferase PlsY [Deinococcus sp. KNUC1210]ULH16734.1 glycerol-3-phosphate 1-O-acyltransferase PlsY [Deinococcus sp. KNUC1210]